MECCTIAGDFRTWTRVDANPSVAHSETDSSDHAVEDSMSNEGGISREHAIELARARYEEKWRPIPGYPSGDTMATSFRIERFESGWLFTPAVVGLDRDQSLAEHYPFYVVQDSGEVWLSPYADGRPV